MQKIKLISRTYILIWKTKNNFFYPDNRNLMQWFSLLIFYSVNRISKHLINIDIKYINWLQKPRHYEEGIILFNG